MNTGPDLPDAGLPALSTRTPRREAGRISRRDKQNQASDYENRVVL